MTSLSPSVACIASLALACALGCGSAPANAPDGGFQLNIALQVLEPDLANGLHVVLHPERSATQALVYVRYYVGSKDDPQGLAGFAHLYEHLMFRGSRSLRSTSRRSPAKAAWWRTSCASTTTTSRAATSTPSRARQSLARPIPTAAPLSAVW